MHSCDIDKNNNTTPSSLMMGIVELKVTVNHVIFPKN